MKYYRVTVKLKNGFTYSYTCIGKMLEGMKRSSEGYWTESVVSEEINEEDFLKTREVAFEKEPKVRDEPKKKVKPAKVVEVVAPAKPKTKRKPNSGKPQLASLENFFDE